MSYMEPARLRIMVADDHGEVRSALRLLLAEQPDMEVVAEAAAVEGLIAGATTASPDLVVVAWNLPLTGSQHQANELTKVISSLRAIRPDLSVIVLGNWPELQPGAMEAGADAYVSKCDPPERVLGTLRQNLLPKHLA